ncbi:hypothetical protein QFC24_006324 [Naganishia onofrii]|uniref:Uncharacterized protein n=1 Tax=Naganishia onofrii TaxID=1851511 RepID=A0ACC2X5N5_9TREE|nr:hypothetical protein QFC24_006324 [Naganishia onofrii]
MATTSTRSSLRKSARAVTRAKPAKQKEEESDLSSDDDDASEGEDVYRDPEEEEEEDGSDGLPADAEDSDDGEDEEFGPSSLKNRGGKRKRVSPSSTKTTTTTAKSRRTSKNIGKPVVATLSSSKKVVVEKNGKRAKKATAGGAAGDNYPLAASDTQRPKKSANKTNNGDNSVDEDEDDDDDEEEPGEEDYSSYSDAEPGSSEDFDLEEGQEIKGRIFAAPKGGHGQISRNTFKFLVNLQNPERNDREWFKVHEPAYRVAEQISCMSPAMSYNTECQDSTESFGLLDHGWVVQPRGRSLIAGGVWAPGKNELASIRQSIKTDPSQLRNIISAPDFTKLFGPASPTGRGKGARCNVFGHDDQLKVAPKGVAKDHADIDLLKLRSIAVVKNFTDAEVTSPEFMDILLLVASKITPLVH